MRIYSFCLCMLSLCLLAASCEAANEDIASFILQRNGSKEIAYQYMDNKEKDTCFKTQSHFICIKTNRYPQIQHNYITQQNIITGMSIKIKNKLSLFAFENTKINPYQDQETVRRVYMNLSDRQTLNGVEFKITNDQSLYTAIAAIRISVAASSIQSTFYSLPFINKYCDTIMDKITNNASKKNIEKSISVLNEVIALNPQNINAHLLKSKFLLQNRDYTQSEEIASKILINFHSTMNAAQAEQLGDIFIGLNSEDKAIQSYKIAMEKISIIQLEE